MPTDTSLDRDARTTAPAPPRFWFAAKRYGWGWGLPLTWEGWTALVGYVVLVAITAAMVPPHRDVATFLASIAALSAALVAVCWWTGEPPRWRWGGDERPAGGTSWI